jgi:hypothetical protein
VKVDLVNHVIYVWGSSPCGDDRSALFGADRSIDVAELYDPEVQIVGAVIVEAVRTPVGRRNGGLSGVHPAELSAQVLNALVRPRRCRSRRR